MHTARASGFQGFTRSKNTHFGFDALTSTNTLPTRPLAVVVCLETDVKWN